MICTRCDGEGYFEIDDSYMSYGKLVEIWSKDPCKDCDGSGEIDDVAKEVHSDINLGDG